MPETLEDIERKIAELEKKIKAIEDIPEGQRTERQEARLDTFYQERVLLRGDKKRLIEGAVPAASHQIKVTFKYGRSTNFSMFPQPVRFTALRDWVQESWAPLSVTDFNISVNDVVLDEENCSGLILTSAAVVVSSLAVGFGDMKKDDVLSYAQLKLLYEIDNGRFGDYDAGAESAEANIVDSEVDFLFRDLTRRMTAFGSAAASEYTMREFISPFLISAALVVGSIELFCERNIRGSRANGPIDYVALYRAFVICVTEAKKLEIEKGVTQNVAQMKACREAFQVHEATKMGQKRRYKEVASEADYREQLPSSGIVSTGEKWRFLRYEFSGDSWHVYSSSLFELPLSNLNDAKKAEQMKLQIREILLKIAGVLAFQKDKCDNTRVTKKNRTDEAPNY
jgi:hypothetical protein